MSTGAADEATPHVAWTRTPLRLPESPGPIVLTVVSTEEEFDWARPFERSATTVRAAQRLNEVQRVFDEFGVRPAYLVDYPIATHEDSAAMLRAIHARGACEIGAHLHPWVSPPHEEEISPRNSFPGNLPAELEARKLRVLTETIEQAFGSRPRSYQAGRYGFGPHTAALLEREGYEVDLSASPPFDFQSEGGPDYSRTPLEPCWIGTRRPLLAVPVSGAFVGFWSAAPSRVYSTLNARGLRWTRLGAVLARVGAIERMRLSPEGFSHSEQRRLVRALLARGLRVIVFSFHSPSLMPGCTPYVRDERGLIDFLDNCRRFYEHVLGELAGVSMTPLELVQHARELGATPR